MSCEICGRQSCTRSFHSLEDQEQHDIKSEYITNRIRNSLAYKIKRLNTILNYGDNEDNEDYVKLSDVLNIIDDI